MMDSFHKGTQEASLKVYKKFPEEALPPISRSFQRVNMHGKNTE